MWIRLSSVGPGFTMSPGLVLVLVLVLAALSSESSLPEAQTGRKFIIVFPENMAYYYPFTPNNKVWITAMYDETVINIKPHNLTPKTKTIHAGESFIFKTKLELGKFEISEKTLVIDSNKKITVQAVSMKNNSVQSALIIPAEKLSSEYLIPPVPTIPGTNDQSTKDVIERNPFQLLIVSTGQETTVTVKDLATEQVKLNLFAVAKFWVPVKEQSVAVNANKPVAVLLTHPCAIEHSCTCRLLSALLPPARHTKLRFFIPPFLANDKTKLLLSGPSEIKTYDPNSPLVESTGPALLYRPGLLLPLIPETDFASCYLVNKISDTKSFAVITVHKDFTEGVRIITDPPKSPDWEQLKGTEYVSTAVELVEDKNVIWHTSSKMAVYFAGRKNDSLFGNPASIISASPDFRGCPLTPEVLELGEVAGGWKESVKYCKDKNLELISMSEPKFRDHVHRKMVQSKSKRVREVWIGLRRSSLTANWYWLNNKSVNSTNWEAGEPGASHDGQCAVMSLEEKKNFEWRDEDCCKATHPVCYQEADLLPL